ASGNWSGFFVEPAFGGASAAGAGVAYSWVPGALIANNDVVSGALAFAAGQGTAPAPLPSSNIAYSLPQGANGPIDAVSRVQLRDLTANNSALSEFRAPLGAGAAPLARDFFSATDGGAQIDPAQVDNATGIVIGSWNAVRGSGGYRIRPADPMGTDSFQSLVGQSFWYVYSDRPTSATLPISGTQSYVLNNFGATDYQQRNATGAAAFLVADFTNRTVTTTLRVDFSPTENWWATGQASIAAGTNQFAGAFSDVRFSGLTGGSGSQSGFLTQASGNTAAGAGLAFNLRYAAGTPFYANGVLQLVAGMGAPPPPPPPPQLRALAFAHSDLQLPPGFTGSNPFVDSLRLNSGDFTLEADGDLATFIAGSPFALLPGLASYERQQAASIGNVDAASDLRWGTWQGGAGAIILSGNTFAPQNFGTAPLSWVLGPPSALPPMLPNSGVLNFNVAGSTNPNSPGIQGNLLNGALNANFAAGTVAVQVTADVGGRIWRGTGSLTLDAQTGQYAGTLTGSIGRIADLSGLAEGFFVAPGQGSATVFGSGLGYTLSAPSGAIGTVSGVIAYTAGTGQPGTPAPENRDLAFVLPGFGPPDRTVMTGSEYLLDAGYNLTSFVGPQPNGGPIGYRLRSAT
ncbi:MAG: hypothetical protein NZM12_09165, partial [Steroidobacteraceae bacterium]|nr:hypothetical protein [Steroidobacteraceae bacterium]MDW8258443.1 hypothetical protein [Gammaproteobacteria bacterium]